jgi:hypothetical protein
MGSSGGIAAVRQFRDQRLVLVGGELGGLRRPASSRENYDILCRWLTAPPARASPAAGPGLTAEAWAEAALTAITEAALYAVNVEELARVLGVTKGSFC